MTTPFSRVKRDGIISQIKSTELVSGDIILLEAGDIVPADARIVSQNALRAEEAALTGESVPVSKDIRPLTDENPPLGERSNMLFMNTVIANGTAEAVVVATGMRTEVGHVAKMLDSAEDSVTPLQKHRPPEQGFNRFDLDYRSRHLCFRCFDETRINPRHAFDINFSGRCRNSRRSSSNRHHYACARNAGNVQEKCPRQKASGR